VAGAAEMSRWRGRLTPDSLRRIVQYLGAGGLGVSANIGVAYLARRAGFALVPAVAAGWVSSVLVGFLANRGLAFRDCGDRGSVQAVRYCLLAGANSLVVVASVSGLVLLGWPCAVAQLLLTGITVVLNYLACTFWVFADRGSPALAPGTGSSSRTLVPAPVVALERAREPELAGRV